MVCLFKKSLTWLILKIKKIFSRHLNEEDSGKTIDNFSGEQLTAKVEAKHSNNQRINKECPN